MRQVAKSDLGKGDEQVKADGGEGADGEDTEIGGADEGKPEGWVPLGQAKKQGK